MCFKQKFLIATMIGLMSASAFAAEYTLEEVSKHNDEKSCWIVIENDVFDVTTYIAKHPAPKVILKKSCGKDMTEGFKTKKGMGEKHSQKALGIKEKLKIGTIIKK